MLPTTALVKTTNFFDSNLPVRTQLVYTPQCGRKCPGHTGPILQTGVEESPPISHLRAGIRTRGILVYRSPRRTAVPTGIPRLCPLSSGLTPHPTFRVLAGRSVLSSQ